MAKEKDAAAAAAAKSLQLCPTLCDPIDSSPPGSPVPGILQARILEWVAISFSNAWRWKVKVKTLSHVWLRPYCVPILYLLDSCDPVRQEWYGLVSRCGNILESCWVSQRHTGDEWQGTIHPKICGLLGISSSGCHPLCPVLLEEGYYYFYC